MHQPLGPDDKDFAVGFVVPTNAPGLKQYVRRPYIPATTSSFDYPLTCRYDEPDSLLVFDDVLVPWDRVFVDRDTTGVRRQCDGAGPPGSSSIMVACGRGGRSWTPRST